MICFYHSKDLDGHCGGAVVKHFNPSAELIGIDYGDDFPWDRIEGEDVVMVDFSLQPFEEMHRLNALAKSFVWIDHHYTALDAYVKSAPVTFEGLQREGIGACQLAWEYYFGDQEIPEAIELLAQYDVWDHSDHNCLTFHAGMNSLETDPSADLWRHLFDPENTQTMINIIDDGAVILRNKKKWAGVFAKQQIFAMEWAGLLWLVANSGGNSKFFDPVVNDPLCKEHDGLCLFQYRDGSWKVSLYADQDQDEPLNCGEIAKKHGGGGHPGKGSAGVRQVALAHCVGCGARHRGHPGGALGFDWIGEPMICFYHSKDLDGHCGGAVVKHFNPSAELIGIDYGDDFPWDRIEGEDVVMVDFSLQPFEEMHRLNALAKSFVWIDHHYTALDAYVKSAPVTFEGLQREGIGACQLAWEYYFGDQEIPEAIELLAQYDVWDHSDHNCLTFHAGMNSLETDPSADLWRHLFDPENTQTMINIIDDGAVILRNKKKWAGVFAKQQIFAMEWAGLLWLVANSGGNSKFFDPVVNDPLCKEHDGLCLFQYRDGSWKVSLYADQDQDEPLNCGEIAKKHGGGGHPGKGSAGVRQVALAHCVGCGARHRGHPGGALGFDWIGEPMICFYHSKDLDGHCGGAVVKHFNPSAELIGIDYGDDFPWDRIEGEDVVMVDFSLQPFEEMHRLNALAKSFVWIDHHYTALDAYVKSAPVTFEGLQREGIGACQLAWEYYFGDQEIPEAIELLAQYDVWDHSDHNCLTFHAGMNSLETDPSADLWRHLFDPENTQTMINIIDDGAVILRNKKKWAGVFAKQQIFAMEWAGLLWLVANSGGNSKFFDPVVNDPLCKEHDGLCLFQYRDGSWKVSLYADQDQDEPLNCGEIAKKHGGGGHPGAAGFQCDSLPFKL